jgi:predicted phage terminase large subunit-like protein
VWWVAPTYGVAAKIWRDLKRACRGGWTSKSEAERRIELPGGGSVEVKSADVADHLRGEGLDGVVLDEAAFIDEQVWKNALRPALSDKQGWAMFLSTPNGKNWFYELFGKAAKCGTRNAERGAEQAATVGAGEGWHDLVDEPVTPSPARLASRPFAPHSALQPPHSLWQTWRLPTAQNPLIPAAELAEALGQLGSQAFSQEYEAQFLHREGAEFCHSYFGESIWCERMPDPRNVRLRVMALDPSKGKSDKADYSAFVLVTVDADHVMWVEADLQRRDVQRIIDDGLELARRFRPDVFAVEANQFQEVLYDIFQERSRKRNDSLPLWAVTNSLNKLTRIRTTLTPHLARGDFRFLRGSPGTELLVKQLMAFPHHEYDDGPDALEMAVKMIKRLLAGASDEPMAERVTA